MTLYGSQQERLVPKSSVRVDHKSTRPSGAVSGVVVAVAVLLRALSRDLATAERNPLESTR